MNILIQSKTLEVTGAMRDFIERQANRISHHAYKVNSVTVSLENVFRKKNDQNAAVARLKVDLPGKKEVVVERRAKNMYEAILDASHRAMRYVRKFKQKRLEAQRLVRSDRMAGLA